MNRRRSLCSIPTVIWRSSPPTATPSGWPRAHRPDAVVRSCPDWTGADLLAHVTAFGRWLPRLFAGKVELSPPPGAVGPRDAAAIWDEVLADLVELLRTTDPAAPVPNWSSSSDRAAFWLRRTAHELAVHHWDAGTLVPGTPAAMPVDVARDGIAEFFDAFVATAIAAGAAPPRDATLHLELTDLGVTDAYDLPHHGPVTTLRGTASDVLLGVWRRREPVDLFVDGDRAFIEGWPRI